MAINVSVPYNGGFLPDIMLLTLCYYLQGTRLYATKSFCVCSLCSYLNVLTFSSLTGWWVDAQKVYKEMRSDFSLNSPL